jgi:hypothetical protein
MEKEERIALAEKLDEDLDRFMEALSANRVVLVT